jgi:hypothetical protein
VTYDVWPEGRYRDNSVIIVSKYLPKGVVFRRLRVGVFDVVAGPVCLDIITG